MGRRCLGLLLFLCTGALSGCVVDRPDVIEGDHPEAGRDQRPDERRQLRRAPVPPVTEDHGGPVAPAPRREALSLERDAEGPAALEDLARLRPHAPRLEEQMRRDAPRRLRRKRLDRAQAAAHPPGRLRSAPALLGLL